MGRLVAGGLGMLTFMYMKKGIERAAGRLLSDLVWVLLFAAIVLSAIGSSQLVAADLRPKTLEAFNRYITAAEARMKREQKSPDDLLYIETLPKSQFDSIIATLKQGGVYVQQVRTRDAKGKLINIPDGMVHHWVGDVFIPGKSVASALDVLRDYNNFKNIYKPEVIGSRLVSREDHDDYKVYLRLQKKSIVPAFFTNRNPVPGFNFSPQKLHSAIPFFAFFSVPLFPWLPFPRSAESGHRPSACSPLRSFS